jgi:hypothetical protein
VPDRRLEDRERAIGLRAGKDERRQDPYDVTANGARGTVAKQQTVVAAELADRGGVEGR